MSAAGPAEVVIHLRARLGEGPRWDHRSGVLAWVDILAGLVHLTDPDTGVTTTVPVGTTVGALALHGTDGYLLAVRNGFATLADGRVEVVAEVDVEPGTRMNDGALDPAGRFLAGTMAAGAAPGGGSLYVLDPGGGVRTLIESVTVSNGLAWSGDGRRLFYVDSATQAIDVMDYDADTGTIARRRRWVEIPSGDGIPDGIAIDGEDCVWVALWGGAAIRRYSPDGRRIGEIAMPVPRVSSCAFGGPGLDRLFVTSASAGGPGDGGADSLDGALFVVEPGCAGRSERVAGGGRA